MFKFINNSSFKNMKIASRGNGFVETALSVGTFDQLHHKSHCFQETVFYTQSVFFPNIFSFTTDTEFVQLLGYIFFLTTNWFDLFFR